MASNFEFIRSRAETCCRQWADSIRRWDGQTTIGLQLTNSVANQRLATQLVTQEHLGALWRMKDAGDLLQSHLFNQTCEVYPKLKTCVKDLQALKERMEAIHMNLETLALTPRLPKDFALHYNADLTEILRKSKTLLDLFSCEFLARKIIVEQILGETERDKQMLLLTVWLHEPYLEGEGKDIILFFNHLARC
eukprot:m.153494 g.153494  ORF g.153494 m.153494 type:complete len:193 (+) comp30836_c1_seq2:1610-2188(+)